MKSNPDHLGAGHLPPAGQSAVWKCRAAYFANYQTDGQWGETAASPALAYAAPI